ncbi:Slam-dependent surface lipoprotein [Pseudomonas huaxiensis]|uniref:Slam-dependent surface lipoprotein n=1 Tax=Pseudomonas huaxiensis TaxID=2213017 RepID=UPI001CDCF36D|nr:Slam-dependent surface lipoprotein [Pseudomonas huaxiensis]
MQKHALAIAIIMTLSATGAMAATVAGGSSAPAKVAPGQSNLFGSNNAGLSFAGSSTVIDIAGGPVAQSNNAIARGAESNGKTYLKGQDVNFLAGIVLGDTKVAQVWKNNVSYNGDTTTINSVRQMIVPPLPFMPDFGGLVIGKVEGSAVYFGEWAPKGANYAALASTDLNMSSADRTVWFSGENPTTSMPTLVNAQYNVVGINQHNPEAPNVYTGVLTANYVANGSNNQLSGSLARAGSTALDFTGTQIQSTGSFSKGTVISGQFYNNANALAGIHTGGVGAQDDVAFGGARQ